MIKKGAMNNVAPFSSPLPYKLIIFDCDGTLVDSEYLNNKAFSDILIEYGLTKYTPEYMLGHHTGITVSNTMLMIQAETGFEFPDDTVSRYIRRVEDLQKDGLTPIKGALDLVKLAAAHLPICVGSNGERSNVIRAIELTGMKDFFPEAQIYTKIQVKQGKPAPDLFLFAAAQMGVEPQDCLVIEDSEVGVQAGVAAGMTVVGYTGSHHEPEISAITLKNAGAHHIVRDFIHISSIIGL